MLFPEVCRLVELMREAGWKSDITQDVGKRSYRTRMMNDHFFSDKIVRDAIDARESDEPVLDAALFIGAAKVIDEQCGFMQRHPQRSEICLKAMRMRSSMCSSSTE